MKKASITFLLIYFLSFVYFAHHINHHNTDKTTKTDAIIVLTGGKNRIQEGINLIDKGMANKLFISGVGKSTSKKDLNIIEDKKTELGRKATSTFENADEVKHWVIKNNISSIRLVTSNYHLPRAMLEIKNKNKNIKIVENPIYSNNISKKWWNSFNTFLFVFTEYNKYLCVYIRNLL